MRRACILFLILLMLAPAGAGRVHALEAPFDPGLMRLAEILGSLHFLRNLCGEPGARWREQMEALIAAEDPEPERRSRLIASFNHGYRAFDGTYTHCTSSAIEAIRRYTSEGEQLTRDITTRYGN